MEHIEFILWMILYPIGSSTVSYISAKARVIEGLKPFSDNAKSFGALIEIIIYLRVAYLLF